MRRMEWILPRRLHDVFLMNSIEGKCTLRFFSVSVHFRESQFEWNCRIEGTPRQFLLRHSIWRPIASKISATIGRINLTKSKAFDWTCFSCYQRNIYCLQRTSKNAYVGCGFLCVHTRDYSLNMVKFQIYVSVKNETNTLFGRDILWYDTDIGSDFTGKFDPPVVSIYICRIFLSIRMINIIFLLCGHRSYSPFRYLLCKQKYTVLLTFSRNSQNYEL